MAPRPPRRPGGNLKVAPTGRDEHCDGFAAHPPARKVGRAGDTPEPPAEGLRPSALPVAGQVARNPAFGAPRPPGRPVGQPEGSPLRELVEGGIVLAGVGGQVFEVFVWRAGR